jgi:PEP-CTERM motif
LALPEIHLRQDVMNAKTVALALVGTLSSLVAWAGNNTDPGGTVPEPETLALVALAGVVGYLVKRRRK